MQHTPPDGSPVDPPSSSWTPFMGGAGRKRSIGQPMTDAGSSSITIPHKVGASAHGGLEYHRYHAFEAKSAAAEYSYHLVLMFETNVISSITFYGTLPRVAAPWKYALDMQCFGTDSLFLLNKADLNLVLLLGVNRLV